VPVDIRASAALLVAIGAFGAFYAYAIFPVLAMLFAGLKRLVAGDPARTTSCRTTISVIIPAHNEERSIEQKLQNVLSAKYPRESLDVIVVSDASTDHTEQIARRFESEGVRIITQASRQGKTAGLNRALGVARGDVVVFTDANALYSSDTIATLVRHFTDAAVGLVTGYTRYTIATNGEISDATNLYTALERALKRAESAFGCCVGADGAIFAMRRSLYRTLRHDDINDFVLPLHVIEQGYQCVFAADTFCSENPGANLESEFRRQSRITNRTLRALWRNAHLLNPFRFPAFSFFLFSHKIMRFMAPAFIIVAGFGLSTLAIVAAPSAVSAVLLASATFVALTIASRQFATGRTVMHLIRVFVTINVAVLHGWWKFLSGHADAVWQHDRSVA
jgi:cellulose synthase/poly-beta-1,6-N-acetylglucosamine synthase-like glycosyltransferase